MVYLALIIPGIMVLLGIEIVLGLVFGFYRPRKPGEFVRPAFDSRLLGWLTRPESIGKIFSETINYQFGFEISKSWFMRLLGKALLPLAVVCIVVIIAMSSIVVVEPHQKAVVTRNGAFVRIAEPGISFKAPWPFGAAKKFDVERVHSIRLGSRSHIEEDEHNTADMPILWSNQHVPEGQTEELLITAPPTNDAEQDNDALADKKAKEGEPDFGEMIGADIDIKYRISDLRQYAGVDESDQGSANPVELLTAIAQREVTHYFATHDAETLISDGRADAGKQLQSAINKRLAGYKVGLEVVFVSVSGVHPPQEVAEDFHARVNALQDAEAAREMAKLDADVVYTEVAGSEEQASRLLKLLAAYNDLKDRIRELESKDSEAPELASLKSELAKQNVAISLLMVESGGGDRPAHGVGSSDPLGRAAPTAGPRDGDGRRDRGLQGRGPLLPDQPIPGRA